MAATTIQGTLVDLLKNAAGLAEYIGSGDTARVYPVAIPQGVDGAAIMFRSNGAERPPCFGDDSGLCRQRFIFECWSASNQTGTAGDAQNMANALRQVLQRHRDYAGSGGVVIQDCMLQDGSDRDLRDPETEAFGVEVEYEIIWVEGT
jgi:hypothetical protein